MPSPRPGSGGARQHAPWGVDPGPREYVPGSPSAQGSCGKRIPAISCITRITWQL